MKSQLKSLIVLSLESTGEVMFVRAVAELARKSISSGSSAARLETLLDRREHSVMPKSAAEVLSDLDALANPFHNLAQVVRIESLTAELLGFTAKQISAKFAEGEGIEALTELGPMHVGSDPAALTSALLGALAFATREDEAAKGYLCKVHNSRSCSCP